MDTIPLITGPTGVGKTDVSLELARLIGGEIVNGDSRQVFRGMDIGTAKPSRREQSIVPHHLFSILDIHETITAGKFLRLAGDTFSEIHSRGKTPVVVGGSTLYTFALTHGLAEIPEIPDGYRADLENRASAEGYETLYRELVAVDPESAARMDASKSQRIIRALEVYHATGKPLSSYLSNTFRPPHNFSIYILQRERTELYDRINRRVDKMLDEGLLDEVKQLQAQWGDDHLYPLRSPGYRETIRYLKEEISYEEMVRLIRRNTRRYAKRQITWYKRYPDEYHVGADVISADYIVGNEARHLFDPRHHEDEGH